MLYLALKDYHWIETLRFFTILYRPIAKIGEKNHFVWMSSQASPRHGRLINRYSFVACSISHRWIINFDRLINVGINGLPVIVELPVSHD